MDLRYDTVSFLSDYGTTDEFVGVVHSVIRSLAPEVRVIDITHHVPVHDVRAGALTLARSAQYLSAGVVVAVVDPGVGTERRAIAVEVGDGASVLVGPDNGLLAPAVAMVGGASRAFELTNSAFHLQAPGNSFDGRDVFAPVAAHLCAGARKCHDAARHRTDQDRHRHRGDPRPRRRLCREREQRQRRRAAPHGA